MRNPAISLSILLIIILGFPGIFTLHGQPKSAYTPFTSKAPIPKEFLETSTEKYQENVDKISRDSSRYLRKSEASFYLESSFMVDGLLKRGRVLFNDEAGNYVNQVADQILRNQPDLRQKLRFYIVKSPIPNAFTTQRGTILINMGLLARLQTEAQLAYILCHEIAHYQKKHVLNRYIEFKSMEMKQGDYRGLEDYDKILAKSNYSKANETEADLLGFELFKDSGYGAETIPAVFDILQDAELPFIFRPEIYTPLFSSHYTEEDWQKVYDKSAAEAKTNTKKPKVYLVGEDDETEEEEESQSTHPAPMIRKEAIKSGIDHWPQKDEGGVFIVSAESFISVKENSKFALIDFYLEAGLFLDALHQILALMPEHADDFYLKKSLAHALYSISKYRNHDKQLKVLLNYENIETDQEFIEGLESMSKSHIEIIALSYIWDFWQTYQDDAVTAKPMLNDLLFDFHDRARAAKADDKKVKPVEPFTTNKLETLDQSSDFKKIHAEAQDEQKEFAQFLTYLDTRKGQRSYSRYRSKQQNQGYSLGVDKVVVFDPFFYSMDLRYTSRKPMDFVKSEQELGHLHEMITEAAKKLNLDVEIIDSKMLKNEKKFQAFEDYGQITQWHNQWNREAEFRYVSSNYDKILEMTERYGTSYFMQMGVISAKFPRLANIRKQQAINFGLFLPPTWPLSLYRTFEGERQSMALAVVYNVESNRKVMSRYNRLTYSANNNNIAPHVYFNLKQVKRSE